MSAEPGLTDKVTQTLDDAQAALAKVHALIEMATRGQLLLSASQEAALQGVIVTCKQTLTLDGVLCSLARLARRDRSTRTR